MVTHLSLADNPVFDALGDPTRRAILDLLRLQPLPAGDIAAKFPMSRPAVAKHVRILKEAKLVREHVQGRQHIYALEGATLASVDQWLQPYRVFWASKLMSLKHLIEAQEEKPHGE
jgi:DNA-binding transcriptional ArsR family regulator